MHSNKEGQANKGATFHPTRPQHFHKYRVHGNQWTVKQRYINIVYPSSRPGRQGCLHPLALHTGMATLIRGNIDPRLCLYVYAANYNEFSLVTNPGGRQRELTFSLPGCDAQDWKWVSCDQESLGPCKASRACFKCLMLVHTQKSIKVRARLEERKNCACRLAHMLTLTKACKQM